MKNFILYLFGLLIFNSCAQQAKDYVSIEGKITNNKDSIISIANRQGIIKQVKLDKNGNFKDTLKVTNAAIYTILIDDNKRAPIYLKNGFDIEITGNSENFMPSLTFSGTGAANSNFVLALIAKNQEIGNPQNIIDLEEAAFTKKINTLAFEYDSILNAYKDLDSTLYSSIKTQNEQLIDFFKSEFEKNILMGKGKPSPKFENYVDYKGGTKSLDSFKGSYVYIDVWATWCGPCIQQIPYLKSLEKEYKNKNITFISISTDESRKSGGSWEAAEKKWRDFVKEKDLSGVQLWSGKDFSFQQDYQITGIPRFILIDPQGKIVDANAPRPSDPNLKLLFDTLKI